MGKKVVIIGVGGIGFDMVEYFLYEGIFLSLDVEKYMEEWGVDMVM